MLWKPLALGMGTWNNIHAILKDKKLKIYEKEGQEVPVAIFNFDIFNHILQSYESDKQ